MTSVNIRGRLVRSRDVVTTVIHARPDGFALQAASLGLMTGTFSPGARGRHDGAAGIMTGDRGYGVNRMTGAIAYAAGPVQQYGAAAAPVLAPTSARVGFGAMSSGQPGLPNTGAQTGSSTLARLSAYQMSNGLGS